MCLKVYKYINPSGKTVFLVTNIYIYLKAFKLRCSYSLKAPWTPLRLLLFLFSFRCKIPFLLLIHF